MTCPQAWDALRRFQGLAAEMAKEREQLVLAESLFDLEQTCFPDFAKVRMPCQSAQTCSVSYG